MYWYGVYIIFHVNSFLPAITFCQVAYYIVYDIDFILMSSVRIDGLWLSIIFIKSIYHIIVQCPYEVILIHKAKVESTFIWNLSHGSIE